MKRTGLLVCCVLFSVIFVSAQPGAKIEFKEELHEFGMIEERAGSVEHRFVFVNEGTAPLIINDIRACCGVRVSDWSKQPVLPGREGFVIGVFDPKGRPGRFEKTITVISNAANEPSKTLLMRGEVDAELIQRPGAN